MPSQTEVDMVTATTSVDRVSTDHVSVESDKPSRRWRLPLPVTLGYLAGLVVVAVALSALSESAQTGVILHTSTNLHNLLHGHISTLFASAFVIGDAAVALTILPLLACLLALAELRFGSGQLVRIFLAGHIGATLLVAVGLWIAVTAEWMPQSIGWAEDVGISYGAMAVLGALVAVLPRPWRIAWIVGWFVVAVEGAVVGQTFTNVGHLLSLLIGVAAGYTLLRTRQVARRGFTKVEWLLLLGATVLAAGLLLG
ncbi:rhomboid-like protein [Nocardia arthritidis]|uniref:Rhomboid family intramembrane serine protease n=1 Tax=Nocardia arthritidis TaxID=228602 RepID=A0A6G9Y889_9NOCA|nr:rhomboid-like protein [Nocardia arthritidis]QIS09421.1 hypothetical protein F5544_07595 [Nocardia arthritidis]